VNELKIEKHSNVLIIFGSEYEGVNQDIFNLPNFNVIIPPNLNVNDTQKGAYKLVESLNVGVSAGIIIHNIKEQFHNCD
jgi:tRNA G18 (ribose-2'-O)-methylase SpoU